MTRSKTDTNVNVLTDQRDTDEHYKGVDVSIEDEGVLVIMRDDVELAWYAAGKWIKADFVA